MTAELDPAAVEQDARDLRRYIVELRQLLFDSARRDGGDHRKVSGSPAPWNPVVGHLLMDVHAGARQLADTLDLALGRHRQPRGSADAGTMKALDRTANGVRLLDERDPGHHLPAHAAEQMARWALRSREQLDQLRPGEEPWTRAPGGLTCPNPDPAGGECGRSLWLAPGWSTDADPPVYCRRCLDEEGHPISWPGAAWRLVVTGAA